MNSLPWCGKVLFQCGRAPMASVLNVIIQYYISSVAQMLLLDKFRGTHAVVLGVVEWLRAER